MNVSDLLVILPVKLASGVALIFIVAWLMVVFRPWRSGEEPAYLRHVHTAVVVALYLAFMVLIVTGVYLTISAAVEQPSKWGAAFGHHLSNIPHKQNYHPD